MKICCISDLHAQLPEIPDCEYLLIAGDICHHGRDIYKQLAWIKSKFYPWVEQLLNRHIRVVMTPGNHDGIFQELREALYDSPFIHLIDEGWTLQSDYQDDIYVWGSPNSLMFGNWNFMYYECELEHKWEMIPEPDQVDILLTHGPPFGYRDICEDLVTGHMKHVGSTSQLAWIEKYQPKYVVCGHIHDGRGIEKCGNTTIINCSLMDESYNLTNEPIIIEI